MDLVQILYLLFWQEEPNQKNMHHCMGHLTNYSLNKRRVSAARRYHHPITNVLTISISIYMPGQIASAIWVFGALFRAEDGTEVVCFFGYEGIHPLKSGYVHASCCYQFVLYRFEEVVACKFLSFSLPCETSMLGAFFARVIAIAFIIFLLILPHLYHG